MGDSQPGDECERVDIFATVVLFDQLILEETDTRLETVGGFHLDKNEVVVVVLELPTGGVLGEKQLGEIVEIVDRSCERV